MDKLFWKFTPTVVCWDGKDEIDSSTDGKEDEEMGDEDVWEEMGVASDGEDSDSDGGRSKHKKRKRV